MPPPKAGLGLQWPRGAGGPLPVCACPARGAGLPCGRGYSACEHGGACVCMYVHDRCLGCVECVTLVVSVNSCFVP